VNRNVITTVVSILLQGTGIRDLLQAIGQTSLQPHSPSPTFYATCLYPPSQQHGLSDLVASFAPQAKEHLLKEGLAWLDLQAP
ncbi:unnamed protein product, partial [Gulo gulo]